MNSSPFSPVQFVRVALPVPLEETFTYSVPDDLSDRIGPGIGVIVPFGRRTLVGVVLASADRRSLKGVEPRPVLDIVDDAPLLTRDQLALTEWISNYYLCGPGEAVRAALPPGIDPDPGRRERRLPAPVTERFVKRSETASIEHVKGKRQLAVLHLLSERGELKQSELLRASGATAATVKRLCEIGAVEVQEMEKDRSAWTGSVPTPPALPLHPAQRAARDAICDQLDTGKFGTFLLHGITGSGKTEVYIEALKRTRESGRSGIILVPEIALTPQTVRRFRSHFGDAIAVLHSRMGTGERFDAWKGIRDGRYTIVIGPRSAILSPVQSLGLIVVDEEHEPSYKQFDPAPRYHARDVAIVRAQMNDAVCVLGSATPALESLANARLGKYTLLSMPERIPVPDGRATLPRFRIVDLRTTSREGVLSPALREAISERISKGQQVILLQNRRGYAPVIACDVCGWTPECPDCSVSMTYHKTRYHLRCHYCGRTAPLPRECPDGHAALTQLGIGTQRVEEELQETIPEARVARMDFDTTSGKDGHHKILERFSRGEADILLGTQMVAKGLDFANVTLVGVIDADAGLHLPDIRSEERAFQLLTQVAGRSGRAELKGEVILQTRNPGHRVIQYALRHDYEGFADQSLEERALLNFPPSGRMIAMLFTGPSESSALMLARRWAEAAARVDSGVALLGPSAAFISRIRKQYRMQILLKIPRSVPLARVKHLIRETGHSLGAVPRGHRIIIDVDPMGMM